ncbi:SRPBCC family protein [Aldersonia sp. NBC_00410]|uniref:SRPBCC family protein n=1 Tax=Aldersonia sp. NBC_00410 TaxID=2975954 RepID=UPI00225714CF|nr:SRPBCC family protein [Aldersonia sp. NBC_00410]MCX5044020.1 SRPBCC family protein [Aldersonia sp. NBC_00410]
MPSYTAERIIDAPREVVYGIFADRENGGDFLPVQTRLVTPGDAERQGVGAVHFLGVGKLGVKEQITGLIPNERIEYRLIAGAPVKDHTGTIVFSDAGNGTRVVYTMDSTPSLPVPAAVLRLGLRGLITSMISGVDKEVRRRAK